MDRLILWDIDRTLIKSVNFGRHIFAAAFGSVTGRVLERMPDFGGRTDCHLVHAVLALHGITANDDLVDTFYSALAEAALERKDQMRAGGQALDGAHAAVAALKQIPNIVQTVVTGNIEPVAALKLSAFDLDTHIDLAIGAYGSESPDRTILVQLARQRAARKHARAAAWHNVVVIGDTPHDIAGARANGAISFGVATGTSSMAELKAAGATVVLPSLADTRAVLASVLADYPISGSRQSDIASSLTSADS